MYGHLCLLAMAAAVPKKEYMYNTRNGKVSFLDEQKFFSFLVERDLVDKYEQFMLSDQSNLWAFLTKDCGISDVELKTLTRYQIVAGDALDAKHSLKGIHAFQRDAQGHAYIPGSSIKGALRTAWLLSAVLADRSTGHSLAPNRRATFPEEKYVNQLHLRTLKDGSIASDAVNSIFRGIQISDSLSIPDNCMMLAGKIRLRHRWRNPQHQPLPGMRRTGHSHPVQADPGSVCSEGPHYKRLSAGIHPTVRCILSADLRSAFYPAARCRQPAAAALSDPGRRLRVLCQVASISLSWRKRRFALDSRANGADVP